MMFHTQRWPLICVQKLQDTQPDTQLVRAYRTIAAELMAPWRCTLNIPSNAMRMIATMKKRHQSNETPTSELCVFILLLGYQLLCHSYFQYKDGCYRTVQYSQLYLMNLRSTLTRCEGKELSPHSQHSTQQAFVRGKPEDVGVYDLPAVVSLVQIVTAALLLHVVPEGEGEWLSTRML